MVGERLAHSWRVVRRVVLSPEPGPPIDAEISALAREHAPVVWLLGKVQSGKSSIIHAITGHPAAEIGGGFKACTRTARIFDFPPEAPAIRFLDTTGLGEVGYDPAEDLAELEQRAHAVLAVARAMDPQQGEILDVLGAVRRRHPDWTIVLAQTCLHEAYPDGADHPPYDALSSAPGLDDLRRSLAYQARPFEALPGSGAVLAVPVDLTRPEDGYAEARYGLDALLAALERAGLTGMQVVLRALAERRVDTTAGRARPHVVGYALAAAASDLFPGVGLVTVPTIQGKLLHSLGRLYGVRWDRARLGRFIASLGTGTALGIALSLGARQLGKLVPVYGQTAGAAAASATSFSVTYALGAAACHFLGAARGGDAQAGEVARVYRRSLNEAFGIVRRRRTAASSAPPDDSERA